MRRGELTRIIVLLIAGAGLVFWLIYATRPEAQVYALESRRSNSKDSRAEVSTNLLTVKDSADENDATSTPDEVAPSDIVPVGAKSSARRIPMENVAGPEPLPGLTPAAVLQNVRSAVRDYGARFGGNPIGNNREITAKLNGGNPKQVIFLKEDDGMRINERGELVDNWGTPFFFHQISAAQMEIRSAGPDRKMWTPDDLVLK